MRILFWSELFWPYVGGAEVFGAQLTVALQERGHQVLVVTSQDYLHLAAKARYHQVPVHRFPFRTALRGGDIEGLRDARRRLVELKRTFKPDLVHINGVNPSVLFHLQTRDAHPAPTLVRVNQELLPRAGAGPQTLMRHVIGTSEWVACVSAEIMSQVRQGMPEISGRSSVIYSGLNAPLEPPVPLPFDAPYLLCLGRLVPAKGFDLALEAFASVRERFPRARLLVAGDGASRPDLERQAADLGLGGMVEFLGWISPERVPALLNRATIVLMPSRREGLPIAALQAAQAGRPIIAARVGGLPEIVRHQQTGFLVEREDSRALADAIDYLLHHAEMASHMGRAAHRLAHDVFGWQRCVAAYDEHYRRLVNSPLARSRSAARADALGWAGDAAVP